MTPTKTTGKKKTPFSLYIHIPFCTKKCPYCHFYVVQEQEELKDLLEKALLLEWQQILPRLHSYEIVSIYFGGGTPSLFGEKRIASLLNAIFSSNVSITSHPEITIEANPETLFLSLAKGYHSLGINRLSLGVQSFDATTLQTLGRTHDGIKAKEAILAAHQSGIENISIDLMYDIPHQTLKRWEGEFKALQHLPITHLSLYNLTFEPKTLFFKKKKELTRFLPSEEASLSMLNHAVEKLEELGLNRYEISAFAKEGYPSLHNMGYWTARPFWGLGPSAFSYFEGRRFQNMSHLHRYAEKINKKESPIDFEERLEGDAKLSELLAVELRLLCGVNLSIFQKKYGRFSKEIEEKIQRLIQQRWLEKRGENLVLTPAGQLFYDSVAEELI